MSFLEKVICKLSPRIAAEREAWRLTLGEMRNYDAGKYDRLNSGWRVTNGSAELMNTNYRDVIRARARDLERNSDIMTAITSAWKRNCIGGGYTLQAKTEDADLNNMLEEDWMIWCKKNNCDITGTQSLDSMLRMLITRKKVDGGILIKKCYTSGGFLPFKLQILEVDELDITQTKTHGDGNKVISGIEVDKYNKPVGYWIRQYDPEGYKILDPVYVEAKDMIFYFTKTRPSQIREISDQTTTLPRIRDTNEFMTAVSVKQRIASCLSVFIKRDPSGMGTGTMGRPGTGAGSGKRQNYEEKTLSPGMILEMNQGDDVHVVNPPSSAGQETQHIKQLLRMTGAGQGLSYESVARDMSETNYSSARQAGIEDGLTYEEEKKLILEILDEIYETFVISCFLAGKIEAKDFWTNKNKYFAHKWVQSAKPWIDPAKEANANRIALQTGQKSFTQIAAEQGRDWQEQINEMAEVLEYGKSKGINMGGVIFGKDYEQEKTNDKG